MFAKIVGRRFISIAPGLLLLGATSALQAAEECEVIAEKLVKPVDVSVEFDVPGTRLRSVVIGVEQAALELKGVKLHYGGLRRDDEFENVGTLQPGEKTKAFDAPGLIARTKLKAVTVLYKFPDAASEAATIQVFNCK